MQSGKNPVTRGLSGVLIVAGAVAINTCLPPSALATFPGASGEIALNWLPNSDDPLGLTYILGIDGTQLAAPNGSVTDTSPKYSPDGSRIAFIESGANSSSIQIMNADGSNRKTLLTPASVGLPSQAGFLSVAWLADGSHMVASVEAPGAYNLGGIFEFAVDGSGFTQVLANMSSDAQTVFDLDGSPNDNSVAFRCRWRYAPGLTGYLMDDYCLLSPNGQLTQLQVNSPTGGVDTLSPPHYTPDGTNLIFTMQYQDPTGGWLHGEIFTMKLDGSALLTQLTESQPVYWYSSTVGIGGISAVLKLDDALMSPDATTIVGHGLQMYSNASEVSGFWSVNPAGGGPSSLIASERLYDSFPARPDWQAFPNAFAVIMQDGHGNPLNGLNVQLFQADGKTPAGGTPVNATGGEYVFPQSIAPGTYQLQATLTDNCQPAGCIPWFDIFYAPGPAAPVQATFTINFDPNAGPLTVNFSDMNSSLLSSNIGTNPPDLDNLDSMADIYFRVRQYTDWVKAHLTMASVQTVHYYTFASTDPLTGNPLPPIYCQYRNGSFIIIMGTVDSAYQNRDGTFEPGFPGDAPENEEWHEFTHHLWFTFVNPNNCTNDVNHMGYGNPNTCDSLKEGFAEFLPTLAGQDIIPTTSAFYDHLVNLEVNVKAWWYATPSTSEEELAVAGLFWDLLDSNVDTDTTFVFARNGSFLPVNYQDTVSMTLGQLWTQLTSSNPVTMVDLYHSFGTQTPTIDLDGDGVPDVSPVDEVFLMHGFFPTDQHPTSIGHDVPYFDVGYAQRTGLYPDNVVIGMTSHNVYNAAGLPIQDLTRSNYPLDPNATVGVTVVDTNGAPVQGASIHMVFNYPDSVVDTIDAPLGGSTDQLHLKLPPYFDYALTAGAALPACNPATDLPANVTLSVEAAGQSSTQAVVLDNCTYLNAVAAAQAPPALSYTFTVPAAGPPPTYTLTLSTAGTGSGTTSGAGTYTAGQSVSVAATPSAGSVFSGWSGANGTECTTGTVVMTANKSCTATFAALVTVPNVVGDTQATAASTITGANLLVGTVGQQSSLTVISGIVVGESPSPGASVTGGSVVNLVVSTGSTCADMALVKAAFGSKRGQPAYNPIADVNNDGVVNITDLSTVARALPAGTTCN